MAKQAKKPFQVRIDPRIHAKFKPLTVALNLDDSAPKYMGEPPTIQAITSALWYWFSQLKEDDAKDWLAIEFARVEAFLAKLPPPSEEESVDGPVPKPTPPPRRGEDIPPQPPRGRRKAR